ncbi:tyrosine-type recombinase/integrase [Laribacter hongkongensis]|uniref:tyrosine-type recombinase/integrase n=1 Tax=Laribacter hongkongensis TaxID=168471 RepID=UPI001EFD27A6|nr:tyrosine-type recombinase/integrase [Laribacter hongkongensis]MCG9100488.1 tyrosine-type recombinase/integrase [Laribacter hongkongensis]MCG9113277.1 tyrosine-type recombinase/integrase [Laribacter hongkongensis]
MGRKPTVNQNLPPRMRARPQRSGTVYFYYDLGGKPRKELPLGSDYVMALRKYAELEIDARPRINTQITFRWVAEKYIVAELHKKAPRTQKDNLIEVQWLYRFFDDPPAPLDSIEPQHIARYRDWRKVTRSTQELALFSRIWNWAREQGYTAKPNPTIGVRRNRSTGRKVYVEDDIFKAVYAQADQPTKDAMDVAYLAAQRPADTLKFRETDIRDGALELKQNKTGHRMRLMLVDGDGLPTELGKVIDRIMCRKSKYKIRSLALIVNEDGQPLTYYALDARFEKARTAAIEIEQEKAGMARDPLDRQLNQDKAAAIKAFQFRDLRAKAATDTDESRGEKGAQELLGHASETMTRRYIRNRLGKRVMPTK